VISAARFGVVCFRVRPNGITTPGELDELNERVLRDIVGEGKYFISSTRLRGAYAMRICVLGFRTAEQDMDGVVAALRTRTAGD
jgi:hypothetical protein